MTQELAKNLGQEEWYQALVEECKAIITETIFNSRWALVEGYHQLGQRIRKESDKKPITTLLQGLAVNLKTSERTLWYAVQLFDNYPKLDIIPEGKNISWNKLITKYLPKPQEKAVKIGLPEGKFNVILADPPWKYEFSLDSEDRIEKHYPTMDLKEIKNLKIPSAENSVLFLWATAPKLEEALEVLNGWGFKYRTCAVWDKKWIGQGYWFRIQHELLLIGAKGNFPPPQPENRVASIYQEKKTEHSKKPQYFYSLIEKMFPNHKYLELFARNPKLRPNWTYWGNELKINKKYNEGGTKFA